ncbi:MAG: hypothetical protein NZ866_02675 [Patescibacteria group bacterium]|nr:hypothetical protein [Patescibacteria group bacterium]
MVNNGDKLLRREFFKKLGQNLIEGVKNIAEKGQEVADKIIKRIIERAKSEEIKEFLKNFINSVSQLIDRSSKTFIYFLTHLEKNFEQVQQFISEKISRRRFLILFLTLIGGSGILYIIIRNLAEKRHLEGLWEIFRDKEKKKKLKILIKSLYPKKNPEEIIENAYRLILTEQYLLSQPEKILEVFGIGASKGLGQITEETFEEFKKEITEDIENQINDFLKNIHNGREISITDYITDPTANFIFVILFFEFLRKKGREILKKNDISRAIKMLEHLSQEGDKFFDKEKDLEERKKIVESGYLKLDELYALCCYSTRETSPPSAWIQSMVNIMKILDDQEDLLTVDGDIGNLTLSTLKELGISEIEIEDPQSRTEIKIKIEDFKDYRTINNILRLQNELRKVFQDKYRSKLENLLKSILSPEFSFQKSRKEVEKLYKLIRSSYQLQIGFHSLIDEILGIDKTSPISYWETEKTEIKFIEDDFHQRWEDYLFDPSDKEKENRFFEYLPPNINQEDFIRHLARVIIIRFSILYGSGIEVPETIINRVGIFSTLGERFPR